MPGRFALCLVAASAWAAIAACALQPPGSRTPVAAPSPAAPTAGAPVTSAADRATPIATSPSPPSPFAFGVEYMQPGLATTYAQTGARWVRSTTSTFCWESIEPQAPRADGQHDYRWGEADRVIAEWQGAGLDIQIYTNANNRWASSKPKHHFPDAQYLDDFEEFVFNLVERYDGDGGHDAPGLKAPILDYTVVEEWTGYFPGTTEEYLQLLTLAHRAIKRANSSARVRLVDFFMIDVFDGNPSPAEVARRAAIDHFLRHPVAEAQRLLAHPELFDIVEIHSLGDYTELYATADWLRAEMEKNGYSKPIWIGDALAVSSLVCPKSPAALLPSATNADFITAAPIRPEDAVRSVGWLEALKDARSARHGVALRWWRALQATETIKKVVVAIDAGYAGLNYAWLMDNAPLFQQPRVTGSWGFQALVDADYNYGAGRWKARALRPAFHAYKLAISRLDGYTSVERLDLGEGIYAYRFLIRNQPAYVLWHDPGRLYFPDEEPPPAVRVRLPLGAIQARITYPVTEVGQSEPRIESLATDGGELTLALDSSPIFVEPVEP